MSIWRNIISWMGGSGTRNKGTQSAGPGNYEVAAATNVTLDTALQLSSVWACVRIITESIGSLPINVFSVDKNGIETPFPDHPLAVLFSGKVNRWQTRQEYFETITYQYVLQGNNYSAIQRNGSGKITSLMPLMTPQMSVELQDSGAIQYNYTDDTGLRVYAQESIWQNKLFGNGIVGLSPLAYARNSVGVAQAAEETTTKIYKNGGKPSGLLMIDKVLKPEQRDKIKQNFSELSEGNADRLFVLEADMKFQAVSLSPQDIELLASRRFQIEDICRFFNVPSIMVNDNSGSTAWGTGIQQILQGFYKFGLRPYLTRYETSMEANLLTTAERGKVKIRFDTRELLQPDRSDRIKSGKEGVTGGLISPNEWRKNEGLAPKDGGESLIVQQQMVPMEQIKDIQRSGSTPAQEKSE